MTAQFKITIQKSKVFNTFKFLLVLLTFNFLLLILPTPAFAQTNHTFQEPEPTWKVNETTESKPPGESFRLPSAPRAGSFEVSQTLPTNVSPTSPLYTDLLVSNLFHSFSCLAVGQSVIGQPCLTYQITKNAQGAIQSVPMLSSVNLSGGTLGAVTSVIGALYTNPPVRTADYLASVGQGLGIVKEANAQVVGSGEKVLNPILKLWQVSRNISYVMMIVIFVVIGLMIMFRNRINPQTVITAQAALPGLVIGLILITFSYFFAGLISDMAFIGTNAVGYYFAAAQGATDDPEITNLVQRISGHNVLSIFSNFVDAIQQGDIENAVTSFLNSVGGNVAFWFKSFAGIIAFQFGAQLGGAVPVIGSILGFITGIIAGVTTATFAPLVLGWVFWFIAIAILIYSMLRLLLRLITAYLTIIFLTITAPFQFLMAALPGRQGIATSWILNMLANILVFPAVIAVFYFIAFIFGRSFGPLKVSGAADKIDIVGNAAFPLFGNMDLHFIEILLAFGALVALPKIPDLIVSTIGKVGQAGQLIGQEISGGIRSGQGYAAQYRGGIGGATGSIARGVGGEIQYVEKGGRWVPYIGKPGLWQWWPSQTGKGTTGGGAGRSVV